MDDEDGGDGGSPAGAGDEQPEARNAERDFHGVRWSNETHRSTTDIARLYRKGRGKEARLGYLGHALMENRHGLVGDGLVSRATGEAERLAAEAMLLLRPGRRRITLGADKGYDAAEFVATPAFAGAGSAGRRGSHRTSRATSRAGAPTLPMRWPRATAMR